MACRSKAGDGHNNLNQQGLDEALRIQTMKPQQTGGSADAVRVSQKRTRWGDCGSTEAEMLAKRGVAEAEPLPQEREHRCAFWSAEAAFARLSENRTCDGNSASAEPQIRLWVRRYKIAGQKRPKFEAFDASTIAFLKANVMSDTVSKPTRVEVVSAVMWKCFMTTSTKTRTSSYLLYNVNIRKQLVPPPPPPLPNHCMRDIVAMTTAYKGENDGNELSTLVSCIREGISELSSKYVDKSRQDESILAIPQDSLELGLAFNYILLMDSTDGGGIYAWVDLKEKNMTVFEQELSDQLAIGLSNS
ncbi:PREDICTED: uncharacterized protein LOC109236620 [Nicotiana attenuata]|uniref:uncharacterized protein LOC109236620 n=1 Tax=Nicotiana attenuata TaxID=49451 RepID=UPI000904B041|nr:PREDICTED: uncharacterized protein LOC109236620 [Nicotiana attenuata]